VEERASDFLNFLSSRLRGGEGFGLSQLPLLTSAWRRRAPTSQLPLLHVCVEERVGEGRGEEVRIG